MLFHEKMLESKAKNLNNQSLDSVCKIGISDSVSKEIFSSLFLKPLF